MIQATGVDVVDSAAASATADGLVAGPVAVTGALAGDDAVAPAAGRSSVKLNVPVTGWPSSATTRQETT